MNPFVKSIHFMLVRINAVLDTLDKRTVDMIRQVFFFLVFILLIAAIIIGVTAGKRAAKKRGITLTESINDTFEIDIKKNRDEGSFSRILETELAQKEHKTEFPKEQYHMREDMQPEIRDRIIENEQDTKEKARFPKSLQREEVAPSTDIHETPLMKEKSGDSPQKTVPSQRQEIINSNTPPLQENQTDKKTEKKAPAATHELKPLLKKDRVAE